MQRTENQQVLLGIRVLDIATAAAAPWVSTYLADFGADVIKVEKPIVGDPIRSWGEEKDGVPLFWQTISRGKRSITLDLKSEKGRELLLKLCETADVLVENFRPGVLERWNLGPEDLHSVNKDLIILRITGFGQSGIYSKKPGFGTLMEAMSGFAHVTGMPDGPPTLPALPLADGITGMYGAFSVMLALHARNTNKVNRGQVIDLALYEPLLRLLEPNAVEYDQLGVVRGRQGNRLPQTTPRNTYKTSDNKWVAISGSTPKTAQNVFYAIGKEHLLNDERFKDNRARRRNADAIDQLIQNWIIEKPLNQVLEVMQQYDVPIAPVYTIKDIFEDQHFNERGTFTKIPSDELGEVTVNNVIPKMSETPGQIKWAGPALGKHNYEILCEELGLSKEDLEVLEKDKII